jgi:hypothetical protein
MATWIFELTDRLSGPARTGSRALEMLESQMHANERAIRSLNQAQLHSQLLSATGFKYDRVKLSLQREQIRSARALAVEQKAGLGVFSLLGSAISPVQALRSRTEELHQSLRRAADSGGLFRSAMSGAGSILGTMATGATAVAAGVAAIGASFVVSTARAADFGQTQKRNLMQSFGAAEGKRQYEVLLEYSNRLGTSLQDTFSQFNTLSRSGFNQSDAISIMQQIGDVQATMGGQAADGITNAIRQIMSKPFPSMEELTQQLAEHGLNVGAVFSEMASARHVSVPKIHELFKSHDITKMEEISAIMRVMNRDFSHGGRAGTGMLDRLHTLGGTIDLIKTRWELFQTRVGDTGAFAPVTAFLGKIAEMMDGNTASGQRFQSQLNSMFTGLFGEVGKQDPVALFTKFGETLKGAGETARTLAGALGTVATGIRAIGTAIEVIQAPLRLAAFLMGAGDSRSSSAASRSVDGGLAAEKSRGLVERLGSATANIPLAMGMVTEARIARVSPTIPPSSVPGIQTMTANRSVNVGDVHVHVDGAALSSDPNAIASMAQDAGEQVREHVSQQVSRISSSGGQGT